MRDREVKIKREIEELLFKPIIVSIDNMGKFEQKEMKKIRPIKNTWCDWFINYFPEPIRKRVGGFKDKIVSLFKTKAPKQTVNGGGKKLNKPKTQNIRSPFLLKNKKKEIKDRLIRDCLTLFETEEEKKERKKLGGKKKLIID